MVIITSMLIMLKSSRFSVSLLFLIGVLSLVGCSSGQNELEAARIDSARAPTPQGLLGEALEDSPGVFQAAISTAADAIINGINLRRAQDGFLPWVVDPVLLDYAYERVIDMAVSDYLDHTAPGAEQILVESGLKGRDFYGSAAELVFATNRPLEEVAQVTLDLWFEDNEHKAVLFSPDLRFVGLGLMGDGEHWIVTLIAVEGRP